MTSVANLEEERLKRSAHTSGPVRCMECPACGLEKGRPVGPFEKEGRAHWVCNCGNDLFYITPEGNYCPHCGVWFNQEEV
jgi:hypothetical protein